MFYHEVLQRRKIGKEIKETHLNLWRTYSLSILTKDCRIRIAPTVFYQRLSNYSDLGPTTRRISENRFKKLSRITL
jgi:hypothetical protein